MLRISSVRRPSARILGDVLWCVEVRVLLIQGAGLHRSIVIIEIAKWRKTEL